jgi:drug/metabolite transporter (DMT)-like permease
MLWFWMALLTAVAWGFCYTCAEQALKYIDKSTYLSISASINFTFWIFWFTIHKTQGKINNDFESAKWWLIGGIAASIAGNYLSVKAIELKNATFASAVEISYPIWCAAFAFLLLGYNPLTIKSAFGLLLVLIGTLIFISGDK